MNVNQHLLPESISEDELPWEEAVMEQESEPPVFIEANTMPSTLRDLRDKHIIPVFLKDNEPLISHSDFIEATYKCAQNVFKGEQIADPVIRISHPVKGRIPEAKHKKAVELLEHEKTIYYERMAFTIEIPGIYDYVGNQQLTLTVGGVKAYNHDNLSNRKGADEHFKVFIGFKNFVCTNLCVWTDGFLGDLKVSSMNQLRMAILALFGSFRYERQLAMLNTLPETVLSQQQFAQIIGRIKLYRHLPASLQKGIPENGLGDSQLNQICKGYFSDPNFSAGANGEISLWRLYNLFTGAMKSNYIDTFVNRSVTSYDFIRQLKEDMDFKQENWYLS